MSFIESPMDFMTRRLHRRAFLARYGLSTGAAALASLLPGSRAQAREEGAAWPLHQAPRARRVIHLCMAGGPSHLETFDYKEELVKRNGEGMPESLTKGQPIAQLQGRALKCLAPQHGFKQYGQSGQHFSELFPRLGAMADEMCIIRSLHTEQINHDPAHTFMNTGTAVSGRPSMGAWLLYGLGAETRDLPGFVVMTSVGKGGQAQPISSRQWHSGFLPGNFQGVQFHSTGDPVHYVAPPQGLPLERQRELVNSINGLNRRFGQERWDPEVETRIAQYEMAFRMQMSVPELMDLSGEPQSILDLYGTQGGDGSFASNCLMARRLAERGVRFIQLYHRAWDHHGGIKKSMETTAEEVDRPTAALIADLKQRGMLDDTLILWGGEFGRTPMAQGSGRDHHIKGFSMFLAGGGVQPGISYGATDEFGYNAVENPVHVHDLHATMLHLMGIEHTRLTFRFQGLDARLTGVAGRVVHPIVA